MASGSLSLPSGAWSSKCWTAGERPGCRRAGPRAGEAAGGRAVGLSYVGSSLSEGHAVRFFHYPPWPFSTGWVHSSPVTLHFMLFQRIPPLSSPGIGVVTQLCDVGEVTWGGFHPGILPLTLSPEHLACPVLSLAKVQAVTGLALSPISWLAGCVHHFLAISFPASKNAVVGATTPVLPIVVSLV